MEPWRRLLSGSTTKRKRDRDAHHGCRNLALNGINQCFCTIFLRIAATCEKGLGYLEKKFNILIAAVAFSCLLIVVRGIHQTIELLQGWAEYLTTNVEYFIGLDGVFMFSAVAIFQLVHPG